MSVTLNPPPPSLPPCIQMVTEAISSLKTESGLSQHAIAKFIEEKYYVGKLPLSYKKKLLEELNELAKSGKLVKGNRSFKLPEKVEKFSAEIEKKKGKKKVKLEEENQTEGETEMMGIRKYLEKYERLSRLMIPRRSKEKLIQKEKANLEEWKKVAEVSSIDLSLVESLENLMHIQHEQLDLNETTLAKIRSLEDSINKKLWDMQLSERNDQEKKDLYERRNEIIKSIPKFWSTAFMSDDALERRLNKEDKKIIKFLRSVVVEGRPAVTPVCTITLNFDKNPYFGNSSLTKNFRVSEKGIFDVRCTPIMWKNGKGNTSGLEVKSSKQSHTDMPKSFFTWFEDRTEKFNDEVANLIARDLWCYAPDYYVNIYLKEKEGTKSKYVKEKIHQTVKMGSFTDELMKIHEKLLEAEKKAFQKRCAVKECCELDSRMGKKVVCQEDMKTQRLIYSLRSEIIKTIPNFWLTAFCSHYALRILLSEEDHKIFKFLESLDVEDTEVGTGVPGYAITLYFRDNPYFKNETLTKTISYSSGGMDVCGSDIEWKGIPTGNQQESLEQGKKRECADGEISFFTWFTDYDDDPDEVAMLIIEDLWPNAIKYFVNGNLVTEEEHAIVEDSRSNLSCN